MFHLLEVKYKLIKQCQNEYGLYQLSTVFLKFPDHMLKKNGGYYSEKYGCEIDLCLVNEILYLWDNKVHTMGCCCGHGKDPGYIQVLRDSDKQKMLELGYEFVDEKYQTANKDCFKPKSKHSNKTLFTKNGEII